MIDIDIQKLYECCTMDEVQFAKFGEVISEFPQLIYIDRGSKILAIAHLDFVCRDRSFSVYRSNSGDSLVINGQLDDRLGVYVILHHLKKLGIDVDVLLTTDEEICSSSANLFYPDKEYNWMFSFDREGTDAVLYDYEDNEDFAAAVSRHFIIGLGSYSDIASAYIDVCGLNVGTGIRNGHTKNSAVLTSVLLSQINRFLGFYGEFKEERFEFDLLDTTSQWRFMYPRSRELHNKKYFVQKYDYHQAWKNGNRCPECGSTDLYPGEWYEDFICTICGCWFEWVDDDDEYLIYSNGDRAWREYM